MSHAAQMNAHHTKMSLKYLDFASSHRKVQLRELMKHIEEFERTRVNDEETFSSDEVKQLFEDLSKDLHTEMYDQLQKVSHHAAVLLRHVFLQAEDNNMQMLVDFASLEDEHLLTLAANMEEQGDKLESSLDPTVLVPRVSHGKLPTLGSSKQLDSYATENSNLKQKVEELEKQIASTRQSSQDSKTADLQAMEEEVASLKATLEQRLDQAPQFRALKQMLQTKNEEIKNLRSIMAANGWQDPSAVGGEDTA